MKVLVTGGAGYIGSVLVPMLLHEGHEVTVYDKLNWGIHSLLHVVHMSNLKIIQGDVTNRDHIAEVVLEKDAIIHLAAVVGFPACDSDPDAALSTNILGTQNVVDNMTKTQILIFASTGSCYGYVEGVCTEKTTLQPLSLYGKSKVRGEEIVQSVGGICLRFATLFGLSPRMRLDLLINNLTFTAVMKNHIQLFEGHFRRTFLHVRDAARAVIFALDNAIVMSGQAFNIGDDQLNMTKLQVVHIIQEVLPDCTISTVSDKTDNDKRDYEVSYEKIHELGFHHKIEVKEGIQEMLKVFPFLSLKDSIKYSNI
ncbi:GDP-D-glycero-alpha-D-manno-heptose dehydrogenase-like [Ruditapes philippinarum]|uniref:GDP-D-glycero-alpha-D-manno-heptose dehydrogenase-like n=1 Tax=Ruditapes philippinarum TaxID=129788 RepID=UPI00295B59E7|nr:GDP-D-glycero-alpha-D-manno-heptose dehydrogenase-like [Ruditapes philippinarum]